MHELVAVLVLGADCFVFAYTALILINLATQLCVSQEKQQASLDVSLHGKIAYE